MVTTAAIAADRIAVARRAFDAHPQDKGKALSLLDLLINAASPPDVLHLLDNMVRHHADRADILVRMALVADGAGAPDRAEQYYRQALAREATNLIARHNLATLLRTQGKSRAAHDILIAGNAKARPAESWMLMGHVQADQGAFDAAVAAYQTALSLQPGLVPAHEALSRLLPQLGRPYDAMASFAQALAATPEDRALWAAAISAAKDLHLAEDLERLAGAACDRFGASPDLLVALSLAFAWQGQPMLAIAQLQRVIAAAPDSLAAHVHLTPLLIAQGDVVAAERHAVAATQLDPLDQSGWAWLSIIWRLRQDPREAWLADYDRFVIPIDLQDAFGDMAHGLPALPGFADHLASLHQTSHHPPDQSPRGGTQTRGDLFAAPDPQIAAFKTLVKARIDDALRDLPDDANHPFLGRRTAEGIDFEGAWSVRLRQGGHHAHHIHQRGWMSSAFYAALPPGVGPGRSQGAIVFGVPDLVLPDALAPRRMISPKAGTLVIFPSYFWHGTLPFNDPADRITLAFDMRPADPAGDASRHPG